MSENHNGLSDQVTQKLPLSLPDLFGTPLEIVGRSPQETVHIGHGWEASAGKYPRCWNIPCKKTNLMGRYQPLQKLSVNIMGGKYASPNNPEDDSAGKHTTKIQTVWKKSQPKITDAQAHGPGWSSE